jgi:DNA-binding NtrC family response regulator
MSTLSNASCCYSETFRVTFGLLFRSRNNMQQRVTACVSYSSQVDVNLSYRHYSPLAQELFMSSIKTCQTNSTLVKKPKLMPAPCLLLLSPDDVLAHSVGQALAPDIEVIRCVSLKDAAEAMTQRKIWGCLGDFRQTAVGGHAEERFLEMLTGRSPDAIMWLATSQPCPEPIERFCACHQVQRVSSVELPNLSAQIKTRHLSATPAAPGHAQPRTPPAPTDMSVTLTGLTRRFETNTPKAKTMLSELEIAARHDVTILLIGETGAGKTFLSRLIHEVSPRRNDPFLTVACGALPADLIESELFGHVRGAFTSAHADKDGKFLAAGRGTILLDEIDVLGPEQQVKLLRVIESGDFEPVGSNRTVRSQARLIVASNLELQPLVQQGKFRPDLYYRLNMLKFELPPLRARKPDIIPLAQRFIAELSAKHNIKIDRVEDSLLSALYNYPWPGNVRELENVIQRAVIYCRDGVLTAQQLPSYILLGITGPTNDASVMLGDHTPPTPQQPTANGSNLGKQIAFTERDIIEQALFKNNYSRTNTAKSLGISRVTLYNKMRKYGMTK